ncbi:hypothetical protein B1207_06440 [Legionella quinlivanii]|uniref:Uncharacterized protein n=1 Tax=Legionella quinlivanii TaxID=45073 RepID=A0A364LKD2_9GAMM|nr:hypothetical protein [Legionella quinlivanii]RAP37058.1 hypothetical protein B1207_06440 [Legionella quinlivanii]
MWSFFRKSLGPKFKTNLNQVRQYHSIRSTSVSGNLLIATANNKNSIFENEQQLIQAIPVKKHRQTLRVIILDPTIANSSGEVNPFSPQTHIATALCVVDKHIQIIDKTQIDMIFDRRTMLLQGDARDEHLNITYKQQAFQAKALFRPALVTYAWMLSNTLNVDGQRFFSFLHSERSIEQEIQHLAQLQSVWKYKYAKYNRMSANCSHPVLEVLTNSPGRYGLTPQEVFCQAFLHACAAEDKLLAEKALLDFGISKTPLERGENYIEESDRVSSTACLLV